MRMIRAFSALVAALAIVSAHSAVFAHEVTHTGTVVALKTARYARPDGGTREVQELKVMVVNPKTKKAASRVFTFDDKTRVFRDGKAVKLAEVSAQKNEKVAVVVDHDVPGDIAIEVRFGAAK